MSGWPAVRTWPAGPTAIGALPIMAGVLVVLFAAPLTAYGLDLLAGGNRPSPATDTVREFDPDRVVWLLAWSPLLSWVALVLGIPAALLAARHGLGGWLVALVAGAAAGTVSSPW